MRERVHRPSEMIVRKKVSFPASEHEKREMETRHVTEKPGVQQTPTSDLALANKLRALFQHLQSGDKYRSTNWKTMKRCATRVEMLDSTQNQ